MVERNVVEANVLNIGKRRFEPENELTRVEVYSIVQRNTWIIVELWEDVQRLLEHVIKKVDSKAAERQTEVEIMAMYSPFEEVVIYVFLGLAIINSRTTERQIKKDYDGKNNKNKN